MICENSYLPEFLFSSIWLERNVQGGSLDILETESIFLSHWITVEQSLILKPSPCTQNNLSETTLDPFVS